MMCHNIGHSSSWVKSKNILEAMAESVWDIPYLNNSIKLNFLMGLLILDHCEKFHGDTTILRIQMGPNRLQFIRVAFPATIRII